jgi:hypothetical protein
MLVRALLAGVFEAGGRQIAEAPREASGSEVGRKMRSAVMDSIVSWLSEGMPRKEAKR